MEISIRGKDHSGVCHLEEEKEDDFKKEEEDFKEEVRHTPSRVNRSGFFK